LDGKEEKDLFKEPEETETAGCGDAGNETADGGDSE
jgi:hypothetical protein